VAFSRFARWRLFTASFRALLAQYRHGAGRPPTGGGALLGSYTLRDDVADVFRFTFERRLRICHNTMPSMS
jgi:hypothetical protein